MKNQMRKTILVSCFGVFITVMSIGLAIAVDSQKRTDETREEERIIEMGSSTVTQNEPELEILSSSSENEDFILPLMMEKDTIAPVISAPKLTAIQGEPVNVLDNVTASDNIDGALSDSVQAASTVDTSVIGEQTVELSVTDSNGNVASVKRAIVVLAPEVVPVQSEDTPTSQQIEQVSVEKPSIEEPVNEPQPAVSAPVVAVPTATPTYQAMTLSLAGQSIPYQNAGQSSGQSMIDSAPVAATWGGAATQSATDGLNTHFIGHNPGVFSVLFSLGIGSPLIVTDATGTPTSYTVQTILRMDDYGIGLDDGKDYWEFIVGTGGGERIILQTCINDSENLLVVAYK